MFVRFRLVRSRRLEASLIETRRLDGKVKHLHVAALGSVPHPASGADRWWFWRGANERLGRLSNRLDAAEEAAIRQALHDRIPIVTSDELAALNVAAATDALASAEARHRQTEKTIVARRALLEATRAALAEDERTAAREVEEISVAKARLEKAQRGEICLDPPRRWTIKEIMAQTGMTRRQVRRANDLAAMPEDQFEAALAGQYKPGRFGRAR